MKHLKHWLIMMSVTLSLSTPIAAFLFNAGQQPDNPPLIAAISIEKQGDLSAPLPPNGYGWGD